MQAGVKVLPIDVDDFFVDLFYYFDKSAKRKEEFHEFQEFTALHAYFDHVSESDQSSRVMRLNQHLKSPLTKLVLLFLEFALDSMCKFNAVFQLSLPMLPALKREVKRLLNILLGRFLKAEAIQEAEADLTALDLNPLPTKANCFRKQESMYKVLTPNIKPPI